MKKLVLILALALTANISAATSGYVFTSLNTTPAATVADNATSYLTVGAQVLASFPMGWDVVNQRYYFQHSTPTASGEHGTLVVDPDSIAYLATAANVLAAHPYLPTANGSLQYVTSVALTGLTYSTTAYNLTSLASATVPLYAMIRASQGTGFDYEYAGATEPWNVALLQANYIPIGDVTQVPPQAAPGTVVYVRGSGTATTLGSMTIYKRLTYTAQ